MASIAELKEAVSVATQAERDATLNRRTAENALAQAIAEFIGLNIGCTVLERKGIGYGRDRRTKETRYRVTRFSYRGYGNIPIAVYGVTLRKDGKEGDQHEIYGEWTVERCAAQESDQQPAQEL